MISVAATKTPFWLWVAQAFWRFSFCSRLALQMRAFGTCAMTTRQNRYNMPVAMSGKTSYL
jgi:hypothetical protein